MVRAVKALWTRDEQEDKTDPKGILFLTDQRLLFEQREEIATKKVLFVTTERKKVQELEKGAVKAVMSAVARRDALAGKLSKVVGTFDHADMTEGEVAKYGVKKLGIACDSGSELAALQGYLMAAAKPAFAADSAEKPRASSIDSYLKGV